MPGRIGTAVENPPYLFLIDHKTNLRDLDPVRMEVTQKPLACPKGKDFSSHALPCEEITEK
jgi:hypothetical protein